MISVAKNRKPITLQGVCNFRDLGGLKSADGRTIRSGRIFRSDELSRLSDADLLTLRSLPLLTIVDLRIEWEINRRPDRTPVSLHNRITCSMDTPAFMSAFAGRSGGSLDGVDPKIRNLLGDTDAKISTLSTDQTRDAMMEMYENLVVEPHCLEVYRRIFTLLLEEHGTPLLFHCMAGKDRTGMVAALILFALGVDEETILEDYLLSNVVVDKKYATQIALCPSLRSLFETRPEYLQAALAKIRSDSGSVDRFLREKIGVDPKEMQKLYLDY